MEHTDRSRREGTLHRHSNLHIIRNGHLGSVPPSRQETSRARQETLACRQAVLVLGVVYRCMNREQGEQG